MKSVGLSGREGDDRISGIGAGIVVVENETGCKVA